jgi:Fe-S cluster biogenesis protein NfuA
MAEPLVALDDRAARERVARVETLLEEVEALADPAARDTAVELVGALLDLYGEGLRRLLDGARAEDELVAHLLLLHGLHPEDVEERVLAALAEVRPYLEQHGGDVELLGVDDGVVRLRLQGHCHGCPSSTATLRLAIEEAIHRTAPDVERVEAEGAVAPAAAPGAGLLQLEVSDALRCPSQLRTVS